MGTVRARGTLFRALIAACAASTACGYPAYDHRGDADIAARIEAARAVGVEDVSRHVGDSIDPATIDIGMSDSAGRDDVLHVLCDVAIPAREAGDPSEGLSIDVWVGDRIVASDQQSSDCFYRSTPPASATPSAPGATR